MSSGQKPVKQVDIARDLQLAPATVNRIVKSLALEGYVLITPDKLCLRNFRLSRNVPMSEHYLSELNRVMHDISERYAVSVEAVVVSGFELLWHSCTEFPDASIAIKARTGFRRTLAELDPLARLYLSRLPWPEINSALLPGGFFKNDINREIIDADHARNIINSAADKTVDFDFDGNHLGVRRFATIIDDDNGRFMHLLSIAEPATPVRDKAKHIKNMTRIISDSRATLKALISKESATQDGVEDHDLPIYQAG